MKNYTLSMINNMHIDNEADKAAFVAFNSAVAHVKTSKLELAFHAHSMYTSKRYKSFADSFEAFAADFFEIGKSTSSELVKAGSVIVKDASGYHSLWGIVGYDYSVSALTIMARDKDKTRQLIACGMLTPCTPIAGVKAMFRADKAAKADKAAAADKADKAADKAAAADKADKAAAGGIDVDIPSLNPLVYHLRVERLVNLIGDNAEALEALKALTDYIEGSGVIGKEEEA